MTMSAKEIIAVQIPASTLTVPTYVYVILDIPYMMMKSLALVSDISYNAIVAVSGIYIYIYIYIATR